MTDLRHSTGEPLACSLPLGELWKPPQLKSVYGEYSEEDLNPTHGGSELLGAFGDT